MVDPANVPVNVTDPLAVVQVTLDVTLAGVPKTQLITYIVAVILSSDFVTVVPAEAVTDRWIGACFWTKAVVAILVLSLLVDCVGAVGFPVSAGDANGAFAASSVGRNHD